MSVHDADLSPVLVLFILHELATFSFPFELNYYPVRVTTFEDFFFYIAITSFAGSTVMCKLQRIKQIQFFDRS